MKAYRNKKWNFSLDYPEDWEILWENEPDGGWEIIVGIAGKPSRIGKAVVTIRRLPHAVINFEPAHVKVFAAGGPGAPIKLPRSPEEYNETCKQELKGILPGIRFILSEAGTLANMPAATLVYSYAGQHGTILEKQINLFGRAVTYRLLGELPEDQLEFAEKYFDKVVSNFKPFAE